MFLRAFRWQSQHSRRTERMKESKGRILSTAKEGYREDMGWTSRGLCRGSEEGSSGKGRTQRGRSAPLSQTNSPSHNPSPTDSFLPLFDCRFFVGVQVRVVQHKQTKQLLALKYINKAKCCKMKAVANIIQERRLLEEVRPSPQLSPGFSLRGRLMRGTLWVWGRLTIRSSSTCGTRSRTTSTASLSSTSCWEVISAVRLPFSSLSKLDIPKITVSDLVSCVRLESQSIWIGWEGSTRTRSSSWSSRLRARWITCIAYELSTGAFLSADSVLRAFD